MKKVFAMVLTLALLVGGAFAVNPKKAEAASTSTSFTLNSNWFYGGTGYLTTSEDNANIYATADLPYMNQAYVKFTVEKVNSYEAWVAVETKNGGLVTDTRNSNVTFYNYGHNGTYLRVVARFYSYSNYTGLTQTVYGKMWQRN